MFNWLYELFVAIVSFVLGLLGFDLKKRSVQIQKVATEVTDAKEVADATVATEAKTTEAKATEAKATDATQITDATEAQVVVTTVTTEVEVKTN